MRVDGMNTDNIKKFGIPIALVLGLLAILMVVIIVREFRGKKEVSMADDIVAQADNDLPPVKAPTTNDITFLYSGSGTGTNTARIALGTNNAESEDADMPKSAETDIAEKAPRTAVRTAKAHPVHEDTTHEDAVGPVRTKHAPVKKAPAAKAAPAKKMTVSGSKPVITDIIIDYNKQRTASAAQPLLVTFAAAMPSGARYADIRIFARRVKGKTIISRDLIHEMHKIYALSGKTQTQFYWTGKTVSGKTLARGTYILYAECEAYTASCARVGAAGRYALPKWSWQVTLR